MKRFLAPVLCLRLLFLFTRAAYASFEETGIGARATAMGGAYTALADDVHAIYYNPAGLAQIQRKEFAASYGLQNTGLNDGSKMSNSYAAYAHPFQYRIGTVGFSWQQFNTENLYKERALSLGYGRRLSRKIFLGASVKQLYREFTVPSGLADNMGFIDATKTDPIYANGNSRSNVGLDLGILWKASGKYSVGTMIQDLNEPDMAIASGSRDIVPMVIRSGVAYQDRRFTLAGQLNAVKSASGMSRDSFVTFAGEKWVDSSRFTKGDLGFRGSFSAGPQSWSQVTMGLSYRIGAVQIDYAFLMPLKGVGFGTTQGNHRMTLSFRFGKVMPSPEAEEITKDVEVILKKAEQELDFYSQESSKVNKEIVNRKLNSEENISEIRGRRMAEGNVASDKRLENLFTEEMNWYWAMKSKGAGVSDRSTALSYILGSFSSVIKNMSLVRNEYDLTRSDLAKAESELALEWEAYLRSVARVSTIFDRIESVSRMIKRFAPAGIDLVRLKEEVQIFKEQIGRSKP